MHQLETDKFQDAPKTQLTVTSQDKGFRSLLIVLFFIRISLRNIFSISHTAKGKYILPLAVNVLLPSTPYF